MESSSMSNVAVYDGNKVKELRKRIAELEEESVGLVRELSLKYEEYDVLNEEVLKLREQVRKCKNENFNLKYNNNGNVSNTNDNVEGGDKATQEEMEFMNLQSKVGEFGEMLRMLQVSYDNVVKENEEKVEQMKQQYERELNKLTQENNMLKRRINTIDEMERKIKSGDINIKDIYSFTGSVGTSSSSTSAVGNNNYNSNKFKSNYKKDNYNYTRNIQRLNSNDDVIPSYDEVQSDINKLRESIQSME